MSLRYFLPIYLLAYIIAAFFWRAYEVWKKTGVNPVVFKGSDSALDFVGRVFKALFAVIVVVVVIYAFIPSAYQYVMPLHWLERTWIKLPGIVLLLVSLLWTLLGLFLMIPNVGTLIALLVGIILIGIQVRLEEEYLTSTHGDTYIEHRRNVRRWI
jgi:hypothetical protein